MPVSVHTFKQLFAFDRWFRVRVGVSARQFRHRRADYYEYLADLIAATAGAKTLLSIFQDDAQRYRGRGARGVLSEYWAQRFPMTGGDLFDTWYGCLPHEDLIAIQAAQYAGAGALPQTLRHLAAVGRTIDEATRSFIQTLRVGFIGLSVALGSLFSIPALTAPQLRRAFSAVPVDSFGPLTRALFFTAEGLTVGWPFLLGLVVLGVGLLGWSLAEWTGPMRGFADHFGLWRLYREVQSVRFLSLLAVLLKPRGNTNTRLRDALNILRHGTTPWLESHIDQMVRRIDAGASAIDALNTALIDLDTWWYLTDLVHTLGLDAGLQRTNLRLSTYTVLRLQRQALTMRWALLLSALGLVLAIAWWHFHVFDELRQALSLHYSR